MHHYALGGSNRLRHAPPYFTMTETVIQNEKYLIKESISRKGLCPPHATVIGSHPLVQYLCADGDVLCPSPDAVTKVSGALWYVLDMAHPDLDGMKKAAALSTENHADFLCIILLKNINSHPTIQRYAEMELLTADEALSGVRAILQGCKNAKAIVLDRLIGAEFDAIGLSGILREAGSNGAVTVTQGMARRRFSALYLPDAVSAIMTVAAKGKPGSLYNATSFYLSEFELRSRLYAMLAPHGVKLTVTDGICESGYAALSAGKLCSLGWEPVCTLDEMLRYTVPAYSDQFDIQSGYIRDSYSGKLGILRQIQLDMLREIDRICRAHHIRYFLSGGSMLGAARHGGYIPWDDDIDVAFLREEYNKFKTVAPAELSKKFRYQSFTNRDGYHYFFDRITAEDTYFASRYSDSYEMPKGISVDIFVYDTVPDSKSAQRRHWKRLMRKRLFMNVRWRNEPRGEGISRMISKLLLPFLRLRSTDSYSQSYDKATRRWEKRRTNTVMAPATDHNWHDCMPREWFTEVAPCRFEDVDTFLPKGYDGFLKNWYGENYMTMLPLCKQQPYHDYYRLDIGSYLDEASGKHFDFSGELK